MKSVVTTSQTECDRPFVSIILPVRNEARFIAGSLSAVLTQDYGPEHMEIIVADGMSTDGTREIIESFRKTHSNLRLIDNPGQIVPTGLNQALAKVRGEIIVRVDGHCQIARDYVRNCVRHLVNDGVDAVGGPLKTVGETTIASAIAEVMSSPFGVGNSAFRTLDNKTKLTDTVAFPTYTRAIVERGGLFDEELVRNQDDEYNYRLRKLGAKILLAADVRSTYYSRSSISSLWKQYFQYGFWKVRVMQKHPLQMRLRQFIPLAFVLALAVPLLLSLVFSNAVWLFVVAATSYALINLSASTLLAQRKGWHLLPVLPLTFATIHVSYGIGFLVGLVRFCNRWRNRQRSCPARTQVGTA